MLIPLYEYSLSYTIDIVLQQSYNNQSNNEPVFFEQCIFPVMDYFKIPRVLTIKFIRHLFITLLTIIVSIYLEVLVFTIDDNKIVLLPAIIIWLLFTHIKYSCTSLTHLDILLKKI